MQDGLWAGCPCNFDEEVLRILFGCKLMKPRRIIKARWYGGSKQR